MSLVHDDALALVLHFLGANLKRPNKTSLLLTLGLHSNDLTRLKSMFSIGEPATGRRQTGGHERSTGKHEADGATIDLDCWEGSGEGVDEPEMGNWRAVKGLEEERRGVYCVEGCSLRAFQIVSIGLCFCACVGVREARGKELSRVLVSELIQRKE